MSTFHMTSKHWLLAGTLPLLALLGYLTHPLIPAVLGPLLLGFLVVWRHDNHQTRDQQLRQYEWWWGNWGTCRHGH